MTRALTTLTLILALTACGGEPSVDWTRYPDDTKSIITADTKAKDCTALQAMFDTFDNKGDSADLLAYIDSQMGNAGCH